MRSKRFTGYSCVLIQNYRWLLETLHSTDRQTNTYVYTKMPIANGLWGTARYGKPVILPAQ